MTKETKKSYFDSLKFYDGDNVEKLIPLRGIQYMNYVDTENCLYIHLEGKTLTYQCSPEVAEKGFKIFQEWSESMDYSDDALNKARIGLTGFLDDFKSELEKMREQVQNIE